ncbi:hypothetical protein TWF718_001960 [Orbilia javanica]|uniref:Uncharacterized protein n=1 Tax=Orbilia javanica TaxID=47235 RepID=A0AAN8MZP5_9PEZI
MHFISASVLSLCVATTIAAPARISRRSVPNGSQMALGDTIDRVNRIFVDIPVTLIVVIEGEIGAPASAVKFSRFSDLDSDVSEKVRLAVDLKSLKVARKDSGCDFAFSKERKSDDEYIYGYDPEERTAVFRKEETGLWSVRCGCASISSTSTPSRTPENISETLEEEVEPTPEKVEEVPEEEVESTPEKVEEVPEEEVESTPEKVEEVPEEEAEFTPKHVEELSKALEEMVEEQERDLQKEQGETKEVTEEITEVTTEVVTKVTTKVTTEFTVKKSSDGIIEETSEKTIEEASEGEPGSAVKRSIESEEDNSEGKSQRVAVNEFDIEII